MRPVETRGQLLRRNLVVALGYGLLAYAGLQLRPVFDVESAPVWPAAGFALAAVLYWGARCWPGIGLGAFVAERLHALAWQPEPVTVLIATGVVLQALAGGWLTRRFVNGFRPVWGDPKVALFLFLGGPLACLISASVATAARYALGSLPAADVAGSWLAWWAGDSIGVLLFTPMLLYLWPGQTEASRRLGARLVLPVLLTAGLLLAGHYGLQRMHRISDDAALDQRIDSVFQIEALAVPQWLLFIKIIQGLFAASENVTAAEFNAFTPRLLRNSPLAFVDFAQRVPAAELADFEASMRSQGLDGYRVFGLDDQARQRPPGARDDYFPIRYTYPVNTDGLADTADAGLGLDHAHSPRRRAAMERALVSGDLSLARDRLLRGAAEPAYLGFVAVYPPGLRWQDLSVDERRRQLKGYVVGVFRTDYLVDPLRAAAAEEQFGLKVWDVSVPGEAELLVDTADGVAGKRRTAPFAFGDRDWRIELTAPAMAAMLWRQPLAQGFLLLSVFVCYLVAFATTGAAGRRAAIEAEVRERTAELKRVATAYRRARDEADAANQAKSAFLATMSHEIRTPMNGVIGLVDVLKGSGLTTYQRDLVTTMQRSGRTLLTLIDDILDFSKIEAGRLELDASPLPLTDLLEGLCDSLLAPAREKGVTLQLFTSPALPERVLADEVRLRQVVYNLVGNGIKFSSGNQERPGRVTVRAEPSRRPPYTVTLQVVDNGIGISDESQQRLFQPFTQGEADTTRRFGGTGLGLAICRRLVELMDGEIEVDSRPDEGACFTVHLPLPVQKEPPTARLDLAGLHCIVVRGDVLAAEDLEIYLRHAGAAVESVETLAQAGERARQAGTAVVIHDAAGQEPDAEAIQREFGALSRVSHLALTRGRRRRARSGRRGIVTLDADSLRRESFVEGVAIAAGRASPAQRRPEPVHATLPESEKSTRAVAAAGEPPSDALAGMGGLHCFVVGTVDSQAADVAAALRQSGLDVTRVDDLPAAAQAIRARREPAVVIHDTEGEPVSFDRLYAHFGQLAGVGHVALTRGQRQRPRYAVQELVSVDIDTLQIEELRRAVAVAAGLAPVGSAATEDAGAEILDREAVDAARRQGRLILVAEDDRTNQRVIQAQLGALGLVAEVASDGREALQRWRNGRYGLLLVDLHMPHLDGYGLTRAIRDEEAPGVHVPIVALTANALREEPRRAREAGMDGYLVKPVATGLLRSTIEQWLPEAGVDLPGQPPMATRSPEPAAAAAVDLAVLQALVGDDPALLRELLGDYRDNAAVRVAELRAAGAKGDLEAVTGAAHKLKSSSRSVGAAALGELCAAMEEAARGGQRAEVERLLATLAAVHQRADAAVESLLRTL